MWRALSSVHCVASVEQFMSQDTASQLLTAAHVPVGQLYPVFGKFHDSTPAGAAHGSASSNQAALF